MCASRCHWRRSYIRAWTSEITSCVSSCWSVVLGIQLPPRCVGTARRPTGQVTDSSETCRNQKLLSSPQKLIFMMSGCAWDSQTSSYHFRTWGGIPYWKKVARYKSLRVWPHRHNDSDQPCHQPATSGYIFKKYIVYYTNYTSIL